MGYETKVILVAIHNMLLRARDLDDAISQVEQMANADGVIFKKPPKSKEPDKAKSEQ